MRIPPFSTLGRFGRGNLHTHSDRSDGALAPEEVIEAYKRAGYDFLQLSDHLLGRYGWPIADTGRLRSNNFTTLSGAEVHAMGTSAGELWHILATGLPLDFLPASPDENGPRLAARALEAGAFVAIAHPAWSQLTIEDGRVLAAAHAVEIYVHGSVVETDRGDGFYLLDQLCNENRRLTAIATDDAHFHHGDYDAFGGFVMVKSESLEPDGLLNALKVGEFYSSQGPRLHDIEVSRSEVTVDCSPVHAISLVTGTSRALTHVRRDVTGVTIQIAQASKKAWSDAAPDKWFRIVIIDGAGRRAWTNRICVDTLD